MSFILIYGSLCQKIFKASIKFALMRDDRREEGEKEERERYGCYVMSMNFSLFEKESSMLLRFLHFHTNVTTQLLFVRSFSIQNIVIVVMTSLFEHDITEHFFPQKLLARKYFPHPLN